MGSRLFLQIPVKRRKNASRISRPCTMHTSMPNKRDLGVRSMRTIYKRRGSATRGRLEEKRAGPVVWAPSAGFGRHAQLHPRFLLQGTHDAEEILGTRVA